MSWHPFCLKSGGKSVRIRAMRVLALISTLSTLFFLANCQQTYAGNYNKRYSSSSGIHGQSTTRGYRTNNYAASSNPLVPVRPLAQPTTPAPKPICAAVCVIDPRTGRILYGHNENERRQVASTQKIITALCVCDAGNLDKPVTIKREDKVNTQPIRLAQANVGEVYTRRSLLQAMLTGSYNDIAYALARDVAGSEAAFAKLMNARARRMKMYNSHFANPHGLPAAQYSTARDMAIAACHAYMNPTIREFVDIPTVNFTLASGKSRNMNNTNKLLQKYSWVNGMKTGYTNAAGRCLISSGSLNGRAVIVVVLGCPKPKIWAESEKYLRWAMGV